MKQRTLNKCLSKLDTIIFYDGVDKCDFRDILNFVRIYIINSTEERIKKYNRQTYVVLLQFINYLIQESYKALTNQFIIDIAGIRRLILKFKSDCLQIDYEEIDFDESPEQFLNKYIGDARGKDEDEDED